MKDYTVKEIAELLKVSKPTVQKVINELNIQFITKGKRDRYYTESNVIRIISEIDPNFDLSTIIGKIEKTEKETEKIENITANNENTEKSIEKTEKETEKIAKDRQITELQETFIETLKKQLESKDKEIADLHRLLEQQQILTLKATQKLEALENKLVDQPEEPEVKEEYRKTWFGLFKRVKK